MFSPFRSGGDLLDAPPGRGEDEVRRGESVSRRRKLQICLDSLTSGTLLEATHTLKKKKRSFQVGATL